MITIEKRFEYATALLKGDKSSPFLIILFHPWEDYLTHLIDEHSLLILSLDAKDWFRTYSPWKASLSNQEPMEGKGDLFYHDLIEEILPSFAKECPLKEKKLILAGYSLSGLFSLYAATKADLFSGVISLSGSLWYPDFLNYLHSHPILSDTIYLSLGSKESDSRNIYFKENLSIHLEVLNILNQQKKNVVFDIVPGGHFDNQKERILKGIHWMIEHFEEA